MSIEQARKEFAAMNAAYQRDLDALGAEIRASHLNFEARIDALVRRQKSAVEVIAKREGISIGQAQQLGGGWSRPSQSQMIQRAGGFR